MKVTLAIAATIAALAATTATGMSTPAQASDGPVKCARHVKEVHDYHHLPDSMGPGPLVNIRQVWVGTYATIKQCWNYDNPHKVTYQLRRLSFDVAARDNSDFKCEIFHGVKLTALAWDGRGKFYAISGLPEVNCNNDTGDVRRTYYFAGGFRTPKLRYHHHAPQLDVHLEIDLQSMPNYHWSHHDGMGHGKVGALK